MRCCFGIVLAHCISIVSMQWQRHLTNLITLCTNIHRPKVRAFEQMVALQALQLDPASRPAYQSSSKALQYLKIGAATLGGGAILAVTGGLAAPAIAAGLGAAVSLLHGGAAAAAAVSAVASSAGGIAATTGGWGWGR